MNIHIRLTGKTEQILEQLIKKGYVADKSEAIRLALLYLDERYHVTKQVDEEEKFYDLLIQKMHREKVGWLAVAEKSVEKVWNNKKDDEVWSKY